jgi:hypothetical protein
MFSDGEIALIKQPMDYYGACVDLRLVASDKERIMYYTKLFYNTICASKSLSRINPAHRDIFKTFSDMYFSGYAGKKLDSGGFSISVLFAVFVDLGVNMLLVDSNGKYYDPYSASFSHVFNYLRRHHTDKALALMKVVNLPDPSDESYPDVILYVNLDISRFTNLPIVDNNFVPETSAIGIELEIEGSPDQEGHAICGFVCDGYYKLFDSAYNIIDDCDWRDILNISNSSYISRMKRLGKWKNIKLYIESAVFVNYNRRLEYLKSRTCTF